MDRWSRPWVQCEPDPYKTGETCWKRDSSATNRKVAEQPNRKEMTSLRFIAIATSCLIINLTPATAYSRGAPIIACDQMQPGHGFEPQTGEPPAILKIEKVIAGAVQHRIDFTITIILDNSGPRTTYQNYHRGQRGGGVQRIHRAGEGCKQPGQASES